MKNRREFLGRCAKMGALGLAGTAGLASFGASANLGANSNASASKNGAGKNANSKSASQNLGANPANKGAKMQFVTLNNGIKMPIVGLGTYDLRGKSGQEAIAKTIQVGYRLIDTAQMYANESEVGAAVANSGVARNEFFITTKLSSDMSYDETFVRFDESMKKLRLDYLDLLLIHGNYNNSKQMYKAMEKLCKDGRIKSLGISNFKASVFTDFVKSCEIIPAVNQCQTHIFYQQKPLRKAMQKYGTILESWSPFVAGRGNFFKNETLMTIAQKHGKSVAQVALRFLIEQGIVVIPKTSKEQRMRENIAVFDFALDESDRKTLSAMDTNKSSFGWDS